MVLPVPGGPVKTKCDFDSSSAGDTPSLSAARTVTCEKYAPGVRARESQLGTERDSLGLRVGLEVEVDVGVRAGKRRQ